MSTNKNESIETPFTLQQAKRGRKVWQPGFVIEGKQMQLFVGVKDQPDQGLLFGEIDPAATTN